jgi:6-phosphogluconate dehydrogenase
MNIIAAQDFKDFTIAPEQNSLSAIGIIGLGIMGRNLLLNISDKGFAVAGYDRDAEQVNLLADETKNTRLGCGNIHAFADIKNFVKQLHPPRAILLLVPAGSAVDSVIDELPNYLDAGDIVIDGGNSHFKDTNRRSQQLAKHSIHFLGIGISGGEAGARNGPSIMAGGPQHAYEQVRPIFEAIAARVDESPCAAWLGSGAAGHFVKMVHNGIEYALMQLLAEAYDFMKHGMDASDDELRDTFTSWNQGELKGYLVDITGDIFARVDTLTNNLLVDEIRDIAYQKGTGIWTSQSAMKLKVPTPTIDAAVAMRDMSTLSTQRIRAHKLYPLVNNTTLGRGEVNTALTAQLGRALYSATLISFAQGMALLQAASVAYEFQLHNETIARLWRGGCIIRADLLNDICLAFNTNNALENLLLDTKIANKLIERQQDLRNCVTTAINAGIPVPALMASLGYFDSYRSDLSPANLIQAQRDYFGAHTYERIDIKGTFHTQWQHM